MRRGDGGVDDGGDVDGRDVDGRDVDGCDVDGRDVDGRDVDGCDVDGRDVNGRDVDGCDVDGCDVDRCDVDGRGVDGVALRRVPFPLASVRCSAGFGGLRRRSFGLAELEAVRAVAAGAGAGGSAGAGAGATGVIGGAFGSFLPCIARRARALGAFGGTLRSIGLVILSVIRAMGERQTRTSSTACHHSSCGRWSPSTIDICTCAVRANMVESEIGCENRACR